MAAGRVVSKYNTTIAERVLDEPLSLDDFPTWGTRKEAREANPYKVGDVVWVNDGRRALVIATFVERLNDSDPISDLLPVLRVRAMTKKGEWSKLWEMVWPGYIQRGYEKWKKEQEGQS
jgi:hypothetical protein